MIFWSLEIKTEQCICYRLYNLSRACLKSEHDDGPVRLRQKTNPTPLLSCSQAWEWSCINNMCIFHFHIPEMNQEWDSCEGWEVKRILKTGELRNSVFQVWGIQDKWEKKPWVCVEIIGLSFCTHFWALSTCLHGWQIAVNDVEKMVHHYNTKKH